MQNPSPNPIPSCRDYYPFGMEMPGRSYEAADYRFGFQAQEGDQELYEGALAFKYRIHDPRIGRFLSGDPLSRSFPWNSSYAFSENRLVDGFEFEGLEFVDQNNQVVGNLYFRFDADANNTSAEERSNYIQNFRSEVTSFYGTGLGYGFENVTFTEFSGQNLGPDDFIYTVGYGANDQSGTGRSNVNRANNTGYMYIQPGSLASNSPISYAIHEYGHNFGLSDRYINVLEFRLGEYCGPPRLEGVGQTVTLPIASQQIGLTDLEYNPFNNLYSSGNNTLTSYQRAVFESRLLVEPTWAAPVIFVGSYEEAARMVNMQLTILHGIGANGNWETREVLRPFGNTARTQTWGRDLRNGGGYSGSSGMTRRLNDGRNDSFNQSVRTAVTTFSR